MAGIVGVVVVAVVGYARFVSAPGSRRATSADETAPPIARRPDAPAPPYLLMRSLLPDESFGQLGVAPADAPDGPRFIVPLTCERVHQAAGRGVCLTAGTTGLVTTWAAEVFDEAYRVVGRVPLTGLPSRARVAPGGRLAAVTVFETGHSYAVAGFSTRTSLLDLTTATEVTDLEQFAVTRDGRAFRAVDFNFWGVTFTADGERFYATLASGGQNYLIEGDVAARAARVVGADVECPSLSPDGARLAYKRAYADARGPGWRLRVRDGQRPGSRAVARDAQRRRSGGVAGQRTGA